jgi:hypothetical protein
MVKDVAMQIEQATLGARREDGAPQQFPSQFVVVRFSIATGGERELRRNQPPRRPLRSVKDFASDHTVLQQHHASATLATAAYPQLNYHNENPKVGHLCWRHGFLLTATGL